MNLHFKISGLLALAVLGASVTPLRAADAASLMRGGGNIETHINARSMQVDFKSRTAFYRQNVTVTDPRVSMTCEFLTAKLPATGNRVDSIIAETNVVIAVPDKGATNYATADKAIYSYSIKSGATNEMLELTGSPTLNSLQGKTTGTKLVWDIANERLTGEDVHMSYHASGASATNSVGTNAAVEPKPSSP